MKIFVACHMDFEPQLDEAYAPIAVGAACRPPIKGVEYRDDSGNNISLKNAQYAELTAAYWAWKNDSSDIIGLSHYRRYFAGASLMSPGIPCILTAQEAMRLMARADIVLPQPHGLGGMNVEQHYSNFHHMKDINMLREIISQVYPEYMKAFELIMCSKKLSSYNMFVGRRVLLEKYFDWLFDILGHVDMHFDHDRHDGSQCRLHGFLGERLMNVWVEKQKPSRIYWPVVNTGSRPSKHMRLRNRLLLKYRLSLGQVHLR